MVHPATLLTLVSLSIATTTAFPLTKAVPAIRALFTVVSAYATHSNNTSYPAAPNNTSYPDTIIPTSLLVSRTTSTKSASSYPSVNASAYPLAHVHGESCTHAPVENPVASGKSGAPTRPGSDEHTYNGTGGYDSSSPHPTPRRMSASVRPYPERPTSHRAPADRPDITSPPPPPSRATRGPNRAPLSISRPDTSSTPVVPNATTVHGTTAAQASGGLCAAGGKGKRSAVVVVVGAGSVGFGEIHDKGVVMGKGNRQGREKKGGGYVELVGGMDGVGIVGGI